MRFIAAIISFVIALGLLGAGVAQRTIFAPAPEVSAAVSTSHPVPLIVVDGAALTAHDGRQTITVNSAEEGGPVFAAYGRSSDITAWVAGTKHVRIVPGAELGQLNTLDEGTEESAPNPAGSDLWLQEFSATDSLVVSVNLPADYSLVVAADGTSPAPSSVTVSWPVDTRAPWSGPLIAAGVALLLVGLVLYIWALVHVRKSRGPRRKPPRGPQQPKLPRAPRPTNRQIAQAMKPKTGAESAEPGRVGRRLRIALPVVVVAALTLSGCTDASEWRATPEVSPSATPGAEVVEVDKPPAVTVPQLNTILDRVRAVASEADETRNAELAATRFSGAALRTREANYTVRNADDAVEAVAALPDGPAALILPQQSDVWPRVVFAVVESDAPAEDVPAEEPAAEEPPAEDAPAEEAPAEEIPAEEAAAKASTALMLVQETPRSNFTVNYVIPLSTTSVQLDVAAAEVGAVRLSPGFKGLRMPAGEIAAAYSAILEKGEESEFAALFDLANDGLFQSNGPAAKKERQDSRTADTELTFESVEMAADEIALLTNGSGALVTVTIGENEIVKPTEAGSKLQLSGQAKSLTGVEATSTGLVSTYNYQVLFYVPPASSTDQIVVLGYVGGITNAKEL